MENCDGVPTSVVVGIGMKHKVPSCGSPRSLPNGGGSVQATFSTEPRASASGQTLYANFRKLALALQKPQCLLERFHKKVLAPGNRLIYAKTFVQVVHAALQDSFPLGIARRQVMRAQGAQDQDCR